MKNKKNNQIDRRIFLGYSAKIAAAGLMLNKLPAATKKYVSFEGEIKVALVGCGGRGTGAAGQAIAADRDVRLVAVADDFADRAQQCLISLSENMVILSNWPLLGMPFSLVLMPTRKLLPWLMWSSLQHLLGSDRSILPMSSTRINKFSWKNL